MATDFFTDPEAARRSARGPGAAASSRSKTAGVLLKTRPRTVCNSRYLTAEELTRITTGKTAVVEPGRTAA
jgi:hypothetical protein